MRSGLVVTVAGLALVLTACGGSGEEQASAAQVATRLKGGVSSITKTVDLTEDTDANELLGRPGGYTSATVLYDEAGQCDDPGVDCGGVVEVFASEKDAKERADYVKAVTGSSPMLAEYGYLKGTAYLRVAGAVKPSAAKEYESTFMQ